MPISWLFVVFSTIFIYLTDTEICEFRHSFSRVASREFMLRLRGGYLYGMGAGMYVTKADFERAGVQYNDYSVHQDWGSVWRSRK